MRRMRNSVRLGARPRRTNIQLDRYIEVLQIKRKEMDSVKKPPDLPTSTPVRPVDAPSPKKTYLAPKTQAPSAKPLLSTPVSVDPAPHLGTWHPSSQKLMRQMSSGRILSEKVCLSVEELLALAPESARHFKEATTRRGYQLCQRRHNPKWPITCHFLMDKHHEHFSAEPALHFGR